MGERPQRRFWRPSVLGCAGGLALMAAGCNLVAGIHESDRGLEGGAGEASSKTDAGKAEGGRGDGAAHRDATPDSHGAHGDASLESGKEPDAHADGGEDSGMDGSGPPIAFTCKFVSEPTQIDDPTGWDSGATKYTSSVFVAPTASATGGNAPFFVIAETDNPKDSFIVYSVQLGDPPYVRNQYWGLAAAGTAGTLFDVRTRSPGSAGEVIEVLSAFPTGHFSGMGVPDYELQAVEPPTMLGMLENPSGIYLGLNEGPYYDGRLVDLGPNDAGVTLGAFTVERAALTASSELGFVSGGASGEAAQETFGFVSSAQSTPAFDPYDLMYATGSRSGALINQLQVADAGTDGGYLVLATLDTPANPRVSGTVTEDKTGALIGGHVSAADPTKVLLFFATIEGMTTSIHTASIAPVDLPGTMLGAAPPFSSVANDSLPITAAPIGGAAGAWAGDDFVVLGPDQTDTALLVVWLGPDGHIVTNAQPISNRTAIGATAIQFDTFYGEGSGAIFDLAWVEHGTPDGGSATVDHLFAAKLSCLVSADGG